MTFGAQGYALARDEGQGLWFFNGLFTVKAGGADTREAFTLIEALLPAGGGAPPHVHHDEEEGFYVLDGEVSITCGDHHLRGSDLDGGAGLVRDAATGHSALLHRGGRR